MHSSINWSDLIAQEAESPPCGDACVHLGHTYIKRHPHDSKVRWKRLYESSTPFSSSRFCTNGGRLTRNRSRNRSFGNDFHFTSNTADNGGEDNSRVKIIDFFFIVLFFFERYLLKIFRFFYRSRKYSGDKRLWFFVGIPSNELFCIILSLFDNFNAWNRKSNEMETLERVEVTRVRRESEILSLFIRINIISNNKR